jgi:cytoskeletal protein CcmA (bactofilin family)
MLRQIIGIPNDGQKDKQRSEVPMPPAPVIGAPAPAPIAQPQRFTPSPVSSPMSTSKNVLANDVEIKGSIKFSHDLIIDGKIEGEVHSDGALTVGENAVIKGEIKTRSVIMFGKVEGNITVTERCELKSNAVLIGDIAAGTLSIEEGATFMGQSQVGKKAVEAANARGSAAVPARPQAS